LKGLFKYWNGLRKAFSNFDFILHFPKEIRGNTGEKCDEFPDSEAQEGQNQTSLTPGSSRLLGRFNA